MTMKILKILRAIPTAVGIGFIPLYFTSEPLSYALSEDEISDIQTSRNEIVFAQYDPDIWAACSETIRNRDFVIIPADTSFLYENKNTVRLRGDLFGSNQLGFSQIIETIRDESIDPIVVDIISQGGSATLSYPIMNAMQEAKEQGRTVFTFNPVDTFSAATLIALAASDSSAIMNAGSTYGLHSGKSPFLLKDGSRLFMSYEEASNIFDDESLFQHPFRLLENHWLASDLKEHDEKNRELIVENTLVSRECAQALIKSGKDVIVESEVALSMGFADAVIFGEYNDGQTALMVRRESQLYEDYLASLPGPTRP
ncbi:MAG: hypothetical protein AAF988_01470 [Pseudomonadota bacterium]